MNSTLPKLYERRELCHSRSVDPHPSPVFPISASAFQLLEKNGFITPVKFGRKKLYTQESVDALYRKFASGELADFVCYPADEALA